LLDRQGVDSPAGLPPCESELLVLRHPWERWACRLPQGVLPDYPNGALSGD
jgi:hypothetical protein